MSKLDFFMKTKYTTKDLEAAHKAIAEGESIKSVLKRTGMTYSPVWCFHTWTTNGELNRLIDLSGMGNAKADEVIAKLREEGRSWGEIACIVTRTEGQCRKAYERIANVQATGTRIGHGGRFWGDEEALYRGEGPSGNRANHGPMVDPGTTVTTAIGTLDEQDQRDLKSMKISELRSLLGLPSSDRTPKVKLLEKAAKALTS